MTSEHVLSPEQLPAKWRRQAGFTPPEGYVSAYDLPFVECANDLERALASESTEHEEMAVDLYWRLYKKLVGDEPEQPFQKADYRHIQRIRSALASVARTERRTTLNDAVKVVRDYFARNSYKTMGSVEAHYLALEIERMAVSPADVPQPGENA